MPKDVASLIPEGGKGYKRKIQASFTVSFVRDKDTVPFYESLLETPLEQSIFVRLCNRIKAISYNSIEYTNIRELGELLNYKNLTTLGHLLETFEEKDLIARIKYRNRYYIYINPKYAYKSRDLIEAVLDFFDCEYEGTNKTTNKTNSKVGRNKVNTDEMKKTYPAIARIMNEYNCSYNEASKFHDKELEKLAEILETDVTSLILKEGKENIDLPNEPKYRHLFSE